MPTDQSLRQWAQLVINRPVQSLKQIQDVDFATKLLTSLDPQYFTPLLHQNITFGTLFTQISKYYSSQIGTNIRNIMGEQVNIYSTGAIQEIWQLVLGIAIKGRNREANINTILRMKTQTQEELMRIISKIINNLGENVSAIDGAETVQQNMMVVSSHNDTELIIQLSEQNQQLREKVQELNNNMQSVKDKLKNALLQIQQKNRDRNQVMQLIMQQSASSKINLSSSGSQRGTDLIVSFIKSIIAEVTELNRQMTKRENRQQYLQDVNKDLKMAYSTVILQMQQMKKTAIQQHSDVDQAEKQIQELRMQNQEYAKRQKSYVAKIGDLEEQKFYLKDIVQRLQSQKSISQKQIEQIIQSNRVISAKTIQPKYQQQTKQQNRVSSSKIQPQSPSAKNQNRRIIKNQMDQLAYPNVKNKLQRQVSYLQKKINNLQQKNTSLHKINQVLEKTINNFTKQSAEIIKNYQSEIDPIFKQYEQIIEDEKSKRENNNNENQQKIRQIMQKMKAKTEQSDLRCVEYQKIIKKFEIQRKELMKALKVYQEKVEPQQKLQQKQQQKSQQKQQKELKIQIAEVLKPKPKPILKSQKSTQLSISPTQPQKQKSQILQDQQQQPAIMITPTKQSAQLEAPSRILDRKTIFIENDQEQQQGSRIKQRSFMSNRQSSFNEANLNFKQRVGRGISYDDDFVDEGAPQICEQQEAGIIGSLVEIVDITQIQEELLRIKEHYLGITEKTEKICREYISTSKDVNVGNSIAEMAKQYQKVGEIVQQVPKINEFLNKFENYGIDKAKLTAQNIKYKQQNDNLRKQMAILKKQRKSILQRISHLQKQSSKSSEQRDKTQFIRLGQVVSQIRAMMLQSQNSCESLRAQIQSKNNQNTQKIQQMQGQITNLKQELQQRQKAIQQLQMQTQLLMGAVLQFRGRQSKQF